MLSLSLQFHGFFSWVVVVHDMIYDNPMYEIRTELPGIILVGKELCSLPRVKSEVGCPSQSG
jgi:hypothetical protein